MWLGMCIGQANYKQFIRFLLSLVSTLAVVMVMLALQIRSIVDLVLGIVVFLAWAPLTYLLGYHGYLKTQNMTTQEHIKRS